jgi:hypothetical protein
MWIGTTIPPRMLLLPALRPQRRAKFELFKASAKRIVRVEGPSGDKWASNRLNDLLDVLEAS